MNAFSERKLFCLIPSFRTLVWSLRFNAGRLPLRTYVQYVRARVCTCMCMCVCMYYVRTCVCVCVLGKFLLSPGTFSSRSPAKTPRQSPTGQPRHPDTKCPNSNDSCTHSLLDGSVDDSSPSIR
jgi:hypothetical protein